MCGRAATEYAQEMKDEVAAEAADAGEATGAGDDLGLIDEELEDEDLDEDDE